MREKLSSLILNYLSRHLVKRVTDEDVLKITQHGWFVGKYKLSLDEVDRMKMEADYILNSLAWKFAKTGLESEAWSKMAPPDNGQALIMGQSMFYNLSIIEKYFRQIKAL